MCTDGVWEGGESVGGELEDAEGREVGDGEREGGEGGLHYAQALQARQVRKEERRQTRQHGLVRQHQALEARKGLANVCTTKKITCSVGLPLNREFST